MYFLICLKEVLEDMLFNIVFRVNGILLGILRLRKWVILYCFYYKLKFKIVMYKIYGWIIEDFKSE